MPIPVKKSPLSHDAFVTYVMHIVTCLTGNAGCPDPTPSVATLTARAEALAQANARAKGGGPGVAADRNVKRKDLEDDLDHLIDYLKGAIKAGALDPIAAIKLILSTGLSVRKSSSFVKPPFVATNAEHAGEVALVARAVPKALLYFWEYSLDGTTWTSSPATAGAATACASGTPSARCAAWSTPATSAARPGAGSTSTDPDGGRVTARTSGRIET